MRHLEPDRAALDARVAALDAHHAGALQLRLDAAVQRETPRLGRRRRLSRLADPCPRGRLGVCA